MTNSLSFRALRRTLEAKFGQRLIKLDWPNEHYRRYYAMRSDYGSLDVFVGRQGDDSNVMHVRASGEIAQYLRKYFKDNNVKCVLIRNALCFEMFGLDEDRHIIAGYREHDIPAEPRMDKSQLSLREDQSTQCMPIEQTFNPAKPHGRIIDLIKTHQDGSGSSGPIRVQSGSINLTGNFEGVDPRIWISSRVHNWLQSTPH